MYLAPSFGPAHRLAGRALLALGARTQALNEYRLAAEQSPGTTRAILDEIARLTHGLDAVSDVTSGVPSVRLAQARYLLDKRAAALALAAGTAEPMLADPDLRLTVARAYLELKEADAARVEAGRVEAVRPDMPEVYLILAAAHEQEKDLAGANAVLARGVEHASRKAPLIRRQAELMVKEGRLAEARRYARELLDKSTDSRATAAAHALLAQIALRDNQVALGIRELRYARDQDPQAIGYRLQLAGLFERLGDLKAAKSELERAVRELGESPGLSAAVERVRKVEAAAGERRKLELIEDLGR
jgi:predicted Zn-dependent protease